MDRKREMRVKSKDVHVNIKLKELCHNDYTARSDLSSTSPELQQSWNQIQTELTKDKSRDGKVFLHSK